MLKKTTLVATAMIPLGGGGGKNVVSAANTKKKGRMLTTTHFWAGKETTPTGFMESSFDCTQSCANSFDPSQAELAGKYCVECCSRTGGFHKNPCTKSSKDSQALQNRRKEECDTHCIPPWLRDEANKNKVDGCPGCCGMSNDPVSDCAAFFDDA